MSEEQQPVSNQEARAAMECLDRFLMQRETNDRDMKVHLRYKAIVQRMTSQKFKQSTLEQLFGTTTHPDRESGTLAIDDEIQKYLSTIFQ